MPKKFVKIILIILCAITILAGCADVQPQDEVAPTELKTPNQPEETAAQTEVPTEVPTGVPSEAPAETIAEVPTEVPPETPTEAPTEAPTEKPSEAPTQAPTEKPTQTPTPTSTPTPEPQANTVTISIDCRNATEAGVAGAPEGGWIMGKKEVELQEGDTVWTVLDRICRERGIAVAKSGSGSTVFVKSIAGVAPVSAQSGWMYSVNGTYIMTSAGGCKVKAGDKIRWKYTMDGGGDI